MSDLVVRLDQLEKQADELIILADQCLTIEQALRVKTLPNNTFGRTRNSPVISKLCADFEHTIVTRMKFTYDEARKSSSSVRKSAAGYDRVNAAADDLNWRLIT